MNAFDFFVKDNSIFFTLARPPLRPRSLPLPSRLLEQCQRMNELFDKPVLLVETDAKEDDRGVTNVPARVLHSARPRSR